MRTLRSESGRQTRSCSRSSTTKVDRSSPTGPKISSALSTRLAESSFAFSKSATREASRLSGYGHVDNARALPTCPQPQQQIQKSNHQPRTKSPTDSPEEAIFSMRTLRAKSTRLLCRRPSNERVRSLSQAPHSSLAEALKL